MITFDDGYADVLHHAKPLLERHSVPATVFVATGAIGQRREFWWDELGGLFLQPGTLPEELELTVDEENDDEVITGSLSCGKCNEKYPITDSIPNLLPPDQRD